MIMMFARFVNAWRSIYRIVSKTDVRGIVVDSFASRLNTPKFSPNALAEKP